MVTLVVNDPIIFGHTNFPLDFFSSQQIIKR